jgi:hypothetical protein
MNCVSVISLRCRGKCMLDTAGEGDGMGAAWLDDSVEKSESTAISSPRTIGVL